jgi:hypothetical protein
MSGLKIRLDVKDLYDGPNEFGVVANIYSIPSKDPTPQISREERKKLQNILIPAGNSWDAHPEFHFVTLPPGNYFVEAILPSEEVVGEEVLVSDSPVPQELRLASKESPHEWMSWQRFSGNVSSAQQYSSRIDLKVRGIPPALNTILIAIGTPSNDQPPAIDPATAWLSQGFFFHNTQLVESIHKNPIDTFTGWQGLNPPARISQPLQASASDPLYAYHNFNLDILTRIIGVPPFPGDFNQARMERYYLFVLGHGFPNQFCILPVPWILTDHSGEATVETLISRSGNASSGTNGLDQGFRISVVVQEKVFGSLIGYLGAGRLPAADTIISRATGLLFEKGENPLAAAAGAYVLLGNPDSKRPESWHEWVRNLMNRFPWLPDGAILYGRLLMQQDRDQNNLKQAHDCFLEGFRRGLPFFSKGVSYLLDGLNRFVNDARRNKAPDEPMEAALGIVRDLSLRTNARQPFTSVLLD